jgi:hypothetical protein
MRTFIVRFRFHTNGLAFTMRHDDGEIMRFVTITKAVTWLHENAARIVAIEIVPE